MDISRVHSLLRTRHTGRVLDHRPVTGSTMDDVRAGAEAGLPEGYTVVADEQTAGRGRLGRAWVSSPAVNLYVSILVRPDLSRMRRLGMVAALAVADAVFEVSGLQVRFKWPNDVRVGERKLCGILIEGALTGNRPAYAIVGIGLNVNFDTDAVPELAPIATSIARETGRTVAREETLAALLNAFERWYDAAAGARTRAEWRARLDTLGSAVTVTFAERTEYGIAEDVDEEGALILRRPDGSALIVPAGEVTLRPPGTPDISA